MPKTHKQIKTPITYPITYHVPVFGSPKICISSNTVMSTKLNIKAISFPNRTKIILKPCQTPEKNPYGSEIVASV